MDRITINDRTRIWPTDQGTVPPVVSGHGWSLIVDALENYPELGDPRNETAI